MKLFLDKICKDMNDHAPPLQLITLAQVPIELYTNRERHIDDDA